MEVAGFALAVIGFLVACGVWIRSLHQAEIAKEQTRQLKAEIVRATDQRRAAQAKSEEVSEKVIELQATLAQATSRKDEKAMAVALWDLELERSYRQWRDVIVPTDAARATGEISTGQQLAFAISQEVERLREEVGVAIRFDGGLDLPMEPESALAALRISEELLALAAKQSDEVVVSVDQNDDPSVIVALNCGGWAGDEVPGTGELEHDLDRMAVRLEGSLLWTNEDDDRVLATLRLPAPSPS